MSQNLILLYQKDQAARLSPGFGTGSYIDLVPVAYEICS
ncbi:hypothetical protein LEP1GSC162_3362 [Leptospira santarosai str. CBC1531]|nr:hypothetical protein LEP1GSC162_3362 [Leptospira santarosai str. CBC1531]